MNTVREQALIELKAEQRREAIDKYKVRVRKRKWYHTLIPYKIIIVKLNQEH